MRGSTARRASGVAAGALLAAAAIATGVGLAAGSSHDQLSVRAWTALEQKQRIVARERRVIREGLRHPAPVPAHPAQAGPAPLPPPWPAGIFGPEEADFPGGSGMEFRTMWRGVVDGRYLAVYAGSRTADPTLGVVMVLTIDPKTWGHRFETHDAPIPGPVRIDAAHGLRLRITSDSDGTTAVFDVASQTFT
jgi:hypothetical protein